MRNALCFLNRLPFSLEACECGSVGGIPAMSTWGLAIIALLLLIGSKIYFSRREPATAWFGQVRGENAGSATGWAPSGLYRAPSRR